MRNRLDVRPDVEVHGRTQYSREAVIGTDLAGRDVLDIGCGFGWFTLWALASDARSVVGIEPRDEDLCTVRRHIRDSRARFLAASAIDLPFADAAFDTVVMWEVLEHLPSGTESKAVREIQRVLRPGGALYLSTPAASIVVRMTDPAWWVVGHRHYTSARVRDIAESAGFAVEAIGTKGGVWEIVHLNNMYFSKWILRRQPLFERALLRKLDREWRSPTGFTNVFVRCRRHEGTSAGSG